MALWGASYQHVANTGVGLTKPAGTVDGDVAYIVLVADAPTNTVGWQAGWVELSISPLITNTRDAQCVSIARKVCSGEPASWAPTVSTPVKAAVFVFSG